MNSCDLRRRHHEMLDRLEDPNSLERVRRFITYLYVYRQLEKEKAATAVQRNDGIVEQVLTDSVPSNHKPI